MYLNTQIYLLTGQILLKSYLKIFFKNLAINQALLLIQEFQKVLLEQKRHTSILK